MRNAILSLIFAFVLCGCQKNTPQNELVAFTGSTMGTTYSIKIIPSSTRIDNEQLQQEIENLLSGINNSMSTYISDSEISRFSQFQKKDWFPVSSDTLQVVAEALRIGKLSEGAFDITVGALVNLWGFGARGQNRTVPADGEIRHLLENIRFNKIAIQRNPPAIRKENPKITLDLSAIAKGYAVDRVAMLLEGKGLNDYLVEIGGEIKTKGCKQSLEPWIVAIERPEVNRRSIHLTVVLQDNGMATSGDYRNYFERNGKRYSHMINPRTGRPIAHDLASVSVVHESCMTADALATALMVLGADQGYRLAEKDNLAAFFMIKTAKGFEERYTPAFTRFFRKKRNQP